ncbi:hypothetical protein ACP275_14G292900 [Erythranthe tilingii]
MSVADGIESVNYIKTGSLVELSVQEILDCAPGHSRLCGRDARFCGGKNSSCAGKSGGNVIDALKYVKKHGISYERDYIPIQTIVGKCKRDRLRKDTVTIDGFKFVEYENEEALLRAVIRQPVIVHQYIDYDNFHMYRGPQLHMHSGDVPSKLLRSPTKCWSCYPCS